MRKKIAALACAVLLLDSSVTAQDLTAEARQTMERADVKRAFDYDDGHKDQILAEWIALTEINAPSGKERDRAEAVRKLLESRKLDKVYYDSRGNLIAIRKGTGGAKPVVFDAHLDTVFQEGLRIKAQVRDGKVFAPGVGDDTRNVEALLAAMRALDEAGIKTKADLIFVFTVEEETSFGGVKHFIAENKDRIGQYVALDGGYEGLNYGGIGINWYKHHFVGPGGHTTSKAPPYSATIPLARAISRIYSLELPKDPVVHLNIGMLGGAEVVNAKAADAWFTVDLRSTDNEVIADLEKKIALILKEEAKSAGLSARTEVISTSPAAVIPGHRDSKLVKMAEAVHRAMGFDPPITPTGSNNSSAALLEGIPSISTGAGPCSDAHALTENCEIEPLYKGIKKILLLELALAGLSN